MLKSIYTLSQILASILFVINRSGNSVGGRLTLADLLERRGIQMSLFTSQDSETAENFLVNLSVLVVNICSFSLRITLKR